MEHAIKSLENTTNSHAEKLQQIVRQIDKTDFISSILETKTALHVQKIQRLEKEVFVAEVFVVGGGLTGLAIYVLHRLSPFFSK